jgi:hypothetical protein
MKAPKDPKCPFNGTWGSETIGEVVSSMRSFVVAEIQQIASNCKSMLREFEDVPGLPADELQSCVTCLRLATEIAGGPSEPGQIEWDGTPVWEWREEIAKSWLSAVRPIGYEQARAMVGDTAFEWLETIRRQIGEGCHRFELEVATAKDGVADPCRGCGDWANSDIAYDRDEVLLGRFCDECADDLLGDTADPMPRFARTYDDRGED